MSLNAVTATTSSSARKCSSWLQSQSWYHFEYTTQCHNPHVTATWKKTFTETKESINVSKFDGILEFVKQNDKVSDKVSFIQLKC